MCAQALITGDLVQFRAGSPPDEACAWTCSPGATGGSTTSRCRSPGCETWGRRMRYYQAAMDVGELGSGEDFGALPESYVLFFCRHDAYGKGEPAYVIERRCWGPSRPLTSGATPPRG